MKEEEINELFRRVWNDIAGNREYNKLVKDQIELCLKSLEKRIEALEKENEFLKPIILRLQAKFLVDKLYKPEPEKPKECKQEEVKEVKESKESELLRLIRSFAPSAWTIEKKTELAKQIRQLAIEKVKEVFPVWTYDTGVPSLYSKIIKALEDL